jgi:dihydropteroate synthase
LRCGKFELSLERPLVMGVVNVTPDSFSDGGRFFKA